MASISKRAAPVENMIEGAKVSFMNTTVTFLNTQLGKKIKAAGHEG